MEKKFVVCPVLLRYGEHSVSCEEALVSEIGITRLFFEQVLPGALKEAIGRELEADFMGLKVRGVLAKQQVEHGAYYDFRFTNATPEDRKLIREEIESKGVTPAWFRRFPRIPTGEMDPDLPIPNLCIVRFVGQQHYVNVLNFTLGGLRFEADEGVLAEMRVGARIQFDLIATNGMVLNNMQAEVRNISVHKGKRAFGVKLVDMHPVNDRKYRELIKDYLTALKSKMGK